MDAQAVTGFYLNELALLALRTGAWLGGGALIGAFYFVTLRWNVGMLAIGRAPPLVAALQLARFTVLAGMLAVIAGRFGAAPLLVTAAGMVAARPAVMRLGERM